MVVSAVILVGAASIPAAAKAIPTVTVEMNLDHSNASATVTIRDLGAQSTLHWTLRGPVEPTAGSCYGVDWSRAPDVHTEFLPVTGDSVVSIRDLHVGGPGCYSYSLRLDETISTEEVIVPAGAATVLYAPSGPSVPEPAYPIDRGIVTLTSHASAGGPVSTLQETGDSYIHHPAARNVVASPGSWGISQQKWRLIQTGQDTYRFLNIESGRALQATNDLTYLPLHETNDPAYASPRFNVVTTPASWNIDQQQIRIERVAGGDGSQVILWGRVGATQQRIEVTPIGYLNIPGVSLVGTGPGVIPWTVSGYTFP